MSLPRRYQQKTPVYVPFFFGGVLAFIALVFALVFSPLAGGALLLLAVVAPLAIFYLSTDQTITCTEQGVTVEKSSRRAGSAREEYAWDEVTGTRFFEVTRRGPVFKVNGSMQGFDDLISIVNWGTRHLPYVRTWQDGGSLTVGPLTLGRSG